MHTGIRFHRIAKTNSVRRLGLRLGVAHFASQAGGMDLSSCIPSDKFDTAAVERAVAIGFPDINPVLPDLLYWLQDANWPVAKDIAPFLANAGPEIAPYIVDVFAGDDYQWQHVLLTFLARNLRPEIRLQIRPVVERIAAQPTDREVEECIAKAAADVLGDWSERQA